MTTLEEAKAELLERAEQLRVERLAVSSEAERLLTLPAVMASAPEPWVKPEPLSAWRQPPEFLPAYLPEPLASMAAALARALQMPLAVPGMGALGVAGLAVARTCEVEAWPGWGEPLTLWTVAVLGSANRKSAGDAALSEPVRAFEREQREAMREEIAKAREARALAEERLAYVRKMIARGKGDRDLTALEQEARDLAVALAPGGKLTVPEAPRLLAEDVTPEKLADMMARHNMRMGVLSAEGTIFQTIDDPYKRSGGSGLPLFLKSHAGESMAFDRLSREALALAHPALTLCLAVQPDVLRELGQNQKYRGRGLLGRFLYAWPASLIGWREVSAPPVPALVARQYHDVITGLLRLPVMRERVTLDAAASDVLRVFVGRLEVRMRPDGDLAHVHDWAGKLAGAVVRISGVCHAVERQQYGCPPWGEEIGAATVERAVRLAEEFLIPHALTTFGEMGADPELVKTGHVLRVVLAWDGESVSRSELHQRLRGGGQFRRPDDLNRPLALLEQFGWVRAMPDSERTGPGRSRSPRYEINPLGRSENPNNPANWSALRHSQDIQDFQEQGSAAHFLAGAAPDPMDQNLIAETARTIATLSPEDLAAYRLEVDSAPAGDPHADHDRAALALYDSSGAVRGRS